MVKGGNIKGLTPTGSTPVDITARKIRQQAQSKFHENEGSPAAANAGFTGEIKIDDTNKRLLVKFSDGWYYIQANIIP